MTFNQAPSYVKLHDDVFQALNAQVSSLSQEKSELLNEFITLQDNFLQEQSTATVLNLFLTHACVLQLIHTSRILPFCFLFIQSSLKLGLTSFVIFIFVLEISKSYPNVFISASYVFLQSYDNILVILYAYLAWFSFIDFQGFT